MSVRLEGHNPLQMGSNGQHRRRYSVLHVQVPGQQPDELSVRRCRLQRLVEPLSVFVFLFLFFTKSDPIWRIWIPGACPEPECGEDNIETLNGVDARTFDRDLSSDQTEEGTLLASTSVFVLEPGASPCEFKIFISEPERQVLVFHFLFIYLYEVINFIFFVSRYF